MQNMQKIAQQNTVNSKATEEANESSSEKIAETKQSGTTPSTHIIDSLA
ncbi:hypothetical protein [Clostridium akagii]|nr:hypothetical protein [Clostridium akagii]